jgi:hypothetical protein
MAKSTKSNVDLGAKLAAIGQAGSKAMQPAVNQAVEAPVSPTKQSGPKPLGVEELVKVTVRLTNEENRKLIRARNELSEQHGQALNTTDILRLALMAFDQGDVTADMLAHIQSTDRRRKSD